jgi:hypothetical protein
MKIKIALFVWSLMAWLPYQISCKSVCGSRFQSGGQILSALSAFISCIQDIYRDDFLVLLDVFTFPSSDILKCVHTARARAADSLSLLPVCTGSYCTDTVANRSSAWQQLIALLELLKPSPFTEIHETEDERDFKRTPPMRKESLGVFPNFSTRRSCFRNNVFFEKYQTP